MSVPSRRSKFAAKLVRPLQLAAGAAIMISLAAPVIAADTASTFADLAAREVIVLVDRIQVADRVLEAEDVVAAFGATSPDARVAAALGKPRMARFSIRDRLPKEYRSRLDPADPEETLQRYVVLSYDNPQAASDAVALIKRSFAVRSVVRNSAGSWSVVPNDTYYAVQFNPMDFQWGMNDLLALQEAWSLTSGIANVGHIDNGIMLGHPELDDAAAPWKTAYRSQFARDFVAGSAYARRLSGLNGVDEALLDQQFAGHIQYFLGLGYKYDGILGFIYPTSVPRPNGTVALYRRYNPSLDDHAIFPENELAAMEYQGYTVTVGQTDVIGYAYYNAGWRPTY